MSAQVDYSAIIMDVAVTLQVLSVAASHSSEDLCNQGSFKLDMRLVAATDEIPSHPLSGYGVK